MRYLLALLFPPLAVLLCGKLFQAVFSLVLCLLGAVTFPVGVGLVLLAMIHALMVVSSHKADRRQAALIAALKARG